MNLSKSRYTQGVTCEKKLWLSCYKPEEAEDVGNEAIYEKGILYLPDELLEIVNIFNNKYNFK